MKTGLLWYDPDPKKAAELKIDEAAARFRQRCGVTPNTCHVNPAQAATHPRLRVVADRRVRPCTFWVGIEDEVALTCSGKPAR